MVGFHTVGQQTPLAEEEVAGNRHKVSGAVGASLPHGEVIQLESDQKHSKVLVIPQNCTAHSLFKLLICLSVVKLLFGTDVHPR